MDFNLLNTTVTRLLSNIWNVIVFLKEYSLGPSGDVTYTYHNADGTDTTATFPNIAKQVAEGNIWKTDIQTQIDNKANLGGSNTQRFLAADAVDPDDAVTKGQLDSAQIIPPEASRGVFGGGILSYNSNSNGSTATGTNTMDYITIATPGNAIDFGDLAVTRSVTAGVSSNTRGVFGGGWVTTNTNTITNTMDYITIATPGNAVDFGDLTVARSHVAGASSNTRGVFGGGNSSIRPRTAINTMDYITIDTIGNAVDFGDLTVARYHAAGVSSPTRGVFGGGIITTQASPEVNTMDYITIDTIGNAIDFGDLTVARGYITGISSDTRGVFGGGWRNGNVNTIDYITISTLGNAVNFGDLTIAKHGVGGVSSDIRGVFSGGDVRSGRTAILINTIEYITINTIGNAVDFGDLTVARSHLTGVQGS